MADLTFFTKGVWRGGVSALFTAIRKELLALQPKDSPTIKWSRDGGLTANVVNQNVTGGGGGVWEPEDQVVSSYAGYFKVNLTTVEGQAAFKIENGGNSQDTIAGVVIFDQEYTIAPATITSLNARIYLKCEWADDALTLSFGTAAALPASTGTIEYILLASYDAAAQTLTQAWLSGAVAIRWRIVE